MLTPRIQLVEGGEIIVLAIQVVGYLRHVNTFGDNDGIYTISELYNKGNGPPKFCNGLLDLFK